MSFNELPFSKRFATMGDTAEAVFEEVKPLGPWIEKGWRRPDFDIRKLSPLMRHKPDYLLENGNLVEVGGLGQDGIFKSMKPEKVAALKRWNTLVKPDNNQVMMFIYNSKLKEYVVLTWAKMSALIANSKKIYGVQVFESDKNEYYPIPWEWLKRNRLWGEKVT